MPNLMTLQVNFKSAKIFIRLWIVVATKKLMEMFVKPWYYIANKICALAEKCFEKEKIFVKKQGIRKIVAVVVGLGLIMPLTACGPGPMQSGSSAYMPGYYYEDHSEVEHNTEEYNYIEENSFIAVKTNPFSTFAADVDTASYANLRRMILSGEQVLADAVRIEEMINYFSYDYPEPEGDEPFSVITELAPCPWNDETQLLLIGMQAEKIDAAALPASNLVFLIDVSGSMSADNKLPLVKRAFLLLLENLSPEDKISIVTYASGDAVLIDGADLSQKTEIMTAIENLDAYGSTHGSAGIETAYDLAEKHYIEGGNNRVILATDGDLNVGITSEGELTRLISNKRDSGIYLSVMGFGSGNIKDNKMEALADNGNGNYSYIDTIDEARKVLVEEMGGTLFTVAKDVKLQVEFNPDVVKAYRLIGYENRRMNAEDFADDTKDGGEIGAGHRVTVLYEIARMDSAFEMPEIESRYGQSQTADYGQGHDENEWLAVNIRYKEPNGIRSKLLTYLVDDDMFCDEMSENMSFAAGVAQFGMILRGSEFLGSTTLEEVISRLKSLPSVETDEYKMELVYIMGKA